MRRVLLHIVAYCCLALPASAQQWYADIAGGVMANSGIRGDGIRDAASGYSSPWAGISVLTDKERWQAGAGVEIFSIRNKTQFVFEQDILPNNITNIYYTSVAAPAYSPQLFANYKWLARQSKVYFYGGLRAGIYFASNKTNDELIYNAQNSNSVVYLQSNPAFIYGLQAGMATNGNKRYSTGFNVAWQAFSTTADVDYSIVYVLPDKNKVPRSYTQNITNTLRYSVNLPSIRVFLRIRLSERRVNATDSDKPENH